MIRWLLVVAVIVVWSGVFCDEKHVHIRIHLPEIKHNIHHVKTVYQHIKKNKHKLTHHSFHHHDGEEDAEDGYEKELGWDSEGGSEDHEEEEYDEEPEDEEWEER